MSARTTTRSSSHAHALCPICQKRLSGEKGRLAQLRQAHRLSADDAKAQLIRAEIERQAGMNDVLLVALASEGRG